ncbi:inositol monophosphatase family protein [Kineosporia succinea]|uniref:Myo-inositol-1(Or 4)-monophosphatase n=1 Tax=Kineosporia succinea TaxID=84632 RepID=A0ABT9PFT8_9ACTN|nr:inositol monophosphatase [Kineosporia succinea]MDP9831030.1 myo-inositol-1(or 4)-monophosphatase [Kineosporia succinea]
MPPTPSSPETPSSAPTSSSAPAAPTAAPPPASSPLDLRHARDVAVSIAQEAGSLLLRRYSTGVQSRPKGDAGDVVTDLDLAAETLILARLQAAFPAHRIVAEESGVHEAIGAASSEGGWTWLVDPLDGTNNVAIGLPAFVVGLALCAGETTVVGVVHDPVQNQTWSAVKGSGAHGPQGLLRPGARPMTHGPVLGWTQGHGVPRTDSRARALKLVMERNSYRTLQLWAPLICWIMLARGHIDGFIGYHAEAVDLPAGSIIAAEAGIEIVSLDGGPFCETIAETERRSFVAGHPHTLEALLSLVRAADGLAPHLEGLPLLRPR